MTGPRAAPRPREAASASSAGGVDWVAAAMGVGFAAMWASAFTSARIIVAHAPPLWSLSARYWIAGAIAVALAAALGQSARLTRAQWRMTALFGICQNALYLGFNFVAMRTVEASLATIVASTLPLLVAGVMLARGERLPPLGAAGLAIGLLGVGLVMGSRISGGVDLAGLALCVAGVIALTTATLTVAGATSGGNVLMVVGLQMLVAALVLTPVAALAEPLIVAPSWALAGAFAYTLLVPGLLATFVWLTLVRRIGATRAAVFHFLTPPVGVGIAWAVLGERLGALDLLGVGTVAAGILMVQVARRA